MEAPKTPTKIAAKSSSLGQEPSKTPDPDISHLKATSLVENSKENGIGVPVNGNRGFGGDLDGGVGKMEMAIDGDLRNQKIAAFSDEVEGLEDSEMSGVSSLLEMQANRSRRGLGSVLDVIAQNEKKGSEGSDGGSFVVDRHMNIPKSDASKGYPAARFRNLGDSKDGEAEEDIGDDMLEFFVGDFVWGKIKSHPWWPGRIYDPLNASDYAKKVKQGDRILVAYFGDGTFAWCNPSQLKPFGENFAEMSKQSSSRNFANALEKAVDEVSRLVDLKMTCSCVPKENLIGFGRSLAVNAGIREGLLVPEAGIEKFADAFFEPVELLSALKTFAQVASVTNMLKIGIFKSWLSAFYRARGGYQLPLYHDPQPIPGLEDENGDLPLGISGYDNKVGTITKRPVEEDWPSPSRAHEFSQTLQEHQGVSVGGQYQRRKQKSMAEILGGHTATEAENRKDDEDEEETRLGELKASVEAKKGKDRGKNLARDIIEVGDFAKGANLGSPASLSGMKKRKGNYEAASEGRNKAEDVERARAKSGTPATSSGRKKGEVNDEALGDGSNVTSKLRKRKESKLSESQVASEEKVSSLELDDSAVNKRHRKSTKPRGKQEERSAADSGEGKKEEKKENIMSAEKMVGGSRIEIDNGKSQEQIEQASSPRERKKSKYLSPPYTDLKVQRKKELDAEQQSIANESQLAESMSPAAGHLDGSPPILKNIKGSPKKLPEEAPGNEGSDKAGPKTAKQDQDNIVDPKKAKALANEVLSHIQYAALNPLYLKESNSLDMVEEFLSAFRSSIYHSGSNYKMYKQSQRGRSSKSQETEPGPLATEQNEAADSSSDNKARSKRTKKSKVAQSDMPNIQPTMHALDTNENVKEPDGIAPGAALLVTFGPGSSLPAKNDLLNIYGKYGALNGEQTDMFYHNYCARIVFLSSSDAEEAFNQSQLASPFGAATVTFRLQYLSSETKTRELKEISNPKPNPLAKETAKVPKKSSASQPSAVDVSELKYVRQRLQMMTSMLEMADGKVSPEFKSKLEVEIKALVEKLSTLVGSPS
uniref:Uncharacterized protein LOC8289805 isoform X1 n=1 Tax=Rhizophora mucronata TaxID=61149 RepID=A0A2P2JFT2_RHIMU